ncbi:BCS1 N terminal-domain-containing protein [Xylariaceae sp. FL1272]|nr:BCS1 N terminal-domain-containing protein [Xylariaceae sp. FL1272]
MAEPPTVPPSLFDLNAHLENPIFTGGVGIASLGAALALGRRGVLSGASLLRRRLLVTVEISKQDPAYPWMLTWLSQPRRQSSFLAKRLTRVNKLSVTTSTSNTPGDTAASFFLQPGYGRHIVKYMNTYIAVNREKQSTAKLNTGEPHETLELTTLYAHRHVFEHVFMEAHAFAQQLNEGKTVIYTMRNIDWVPLGEPKTKRPLGSVILDEGVGEALVNDAREFLARQQWYVDRGIPYRRGYLLYGPPGSGKTSFIQALAGELGYNLAMINLNQVGVTDDKLAFLLTKLPQRSIVLLEDADAAFANRRMRDSDGYSGGTVTYSGLLNALDGVTASEDRILFLTTNHPERLDPAMIRPGRVDMMVHIGKATRYQAKQMWDRFYGDVDKEGVNRERFLARLDELGLFREAAEGDTPIRTSTAAIQGLFLTNKNDMEGAINMAEGLIPQKVESEPL